MSDGGQGNPGPLTPGALTGLQENPVLGDNEVRFSTDIVRAQMQPEISAMETPTLASAPAESSPAATPLRACSISSLDILPATIDCRRWLCVCLLNTF